MSSACTTPIPFAEGLAWLLGEADPATSARLERHLFACASCTRDLETVHRLCRDVEGVLREGRIGVAVTADLLGRASADGMRLRTYRMAPGEEVRCTAAPEDDAVVVRLVLPDDAPETVDLVAQVTMLDDDERFARVTEDLVIDRTRGEVAYLFPAAFIRSLPRSRWELETRRRGMAGEPLARYAMTHTPWEQLTAADRDDAS